MSDAPVTPVDDAKPPRRLLPWLLLVALGGAAAVACTVAGGPGVDLEAPSLPVLKVSHVGKAAASGSPVASPEPSPKPSPSPFDVDALLAFPSPPPTCFVRRTRDQALRSWGGPIAPHVFYVPSQTGRRFRYGAECVRRALAGRNIVLVGDSLIRYQYLSLVFFLRHGVYPDQDTMVSSPSIMWERAGWGAWNTFLAATNELMGDAECCECQREGETVPVENRYYHDATHGFNVSFVSFGDGARGGDMMGWTPDCPKATGGRFRTTVNVTWPPSFAFLRERYKQLPTLDAMVAHLESIWGPAAVSDLLITSGWWSHTQTEFINAAKGMNDATSAAMDAVQSLMARGRKPTWATHGGSTGHVPRVSLHGIMVATDEAPVVEEALRRKWQVFRRLEAIQALEAHLMDVIPNTKTHPPSRDIYVDQHVHLAGFVNAALNDELLDMLVPSKTACESCPADLWG